MTRTRFLLIMLALVTVLALTGCGRIDESSVDSSSPEGIQTFGVDVNPSAQPSMGQVMPEILDVPDETVPDDNTVTGDENIQFTETVPVEEPEEETAAPAPSKAPSTSTSTSTPAVSETPVSPSPTIAPPAPMSSATQDDAQAYVGKSLKELIEALGYPSASEYNPVDEEDPSLGEIGTLYFADYTVKTKRVDGVETVTSVTPITPPAEESPDPSTAEAPDEPTPSE